MIIQKFSETKSAIGGTPEEINPLFLSLWNWGATDNELLNLGDSNNFVYFFVNLNEYVYYRAVALCESGLAGKAPKAWGGTWDKAVAMANAELENMTEERFLDYGFAPLDLVYNFSEQDLCQT